MEPKELGARVRQGRKKLGLGQRELAELAGIGIGTVQNIEGGKVNKPHPGNLEALESILGPLGNGSMVEPPVDEDQDVIFPADVEAFRDTVGLYLIQFDEETRLQVMKTINRQIIFAAKPRHDSV